MPYRGLKYSRIPISTGDLFHNLPQMLETKNSSKPYIQHKKGWEKDHKAYPLLCYIEGSGKPRITETIGASPVDMGNPTL